MAYTTELTAALTGATMGQLARWRRPTMNEPAALVPELGKAGGALLYSFRDLIALRTFVRLRESTSMQMIRKSVGTLEKIGDREHLSAYTLAREVGDDGRTIDLRWVLDEGNSVSLARRRGQMVMDLLPMAEITDAFVISFGGRERSAPNLYEPHEYVSLDPEVVGGYPVISDTRIPFDSVATLLRDGLAPEQVPSIYPSVSPAAAAAAFEWWRSVTDVDEAA